MTKAELVDEIAQKADLTRKHSEVIVDAVFSSIIEALQGGDKIELRGFGSFRVRHRASRTGRNPFSKSSACRRFSPCFCARSAPPAWR